ncbi:MAG: FAD-binding oxidoreductase [Deltaproteobacteria bacterium]|nr:FAD-binding oxidoreductase [Deltaproteobacteria bacterium]
MRRLAGNLELVHRLREIFGADRISHSPAVSTVYARDLAADAEWNLRAGRWPERPDFVVWPETAEEISRLVRLANDWKIPIVPYGGGTGIRGGVRAVGGGIVCDMKRMNRLVWLDETALIVAVQAGITGTQLERRLRRRGFTLGAFAFRHPASTVGGVLAVRGGGPATERYGRLVDKVVKLRAVLPDGLIVKTFPAPRSATGPDFDHLLLGSEGTLGIIFRALLRVHMLPASRTLVAARFDTLAEGADALRAMCRDGVRPAGAKLADPAEARAFFMDPDLPPPVGFVLCAMFEGHPRRVELEKEMAIDRVHHHGGRLVDDALAEWWLRHPYAEPFRVAPALAGSRVNFEWVDLSGTWGDLAGIYDAAHAALSAIGDVTAHISAPDANGAALTLCVTGRPDGGVDDDEWNAALGRACEAAMAAGAGISRHLGVGTRRIHAHEREAGAFADRLRDLKARLDPRGILNPGKLVAAAAPPEAR